MEGLVFGPAQQPWVTRTLTILPALVHAQDGGAVRLMLSEAGAMAPDLPSDLGGGGGRMQDALTVAEVLGRSLPRSRTAWWLEPAPVRCLHAGEHLRTHLTAVLNGSLSVALVDATALPLRLERRGAVARLLGDIPPLVVPTDARHLLFAFEERPDFYALALCSVNHAALRFEALPGLPLALASGVLDVEVAEECLVADAHWEVHRALAHEELLRGARAVGEAVAVWDALGAHSTDAPALVIARTALYAAAERLSDPGPHSLLGEDGRMGVADAALEARALARMAVRTAAASVARADAEAPALAWLMMDVADLGAVESARGPFHRLGEARQGALFQVRARSSSAARAVPETRTPLPANAPPEARRTAAGRSSTTRLRNAAAESGPLPFVPEPLWAWQREVREAVRDVLEPAAGAHARAGSWPAGLWDNLAARGWMGPTHRPDPPQSPGPVAQAVLLEEMGRVPPELAARVVANARVAWWLEAHSGLAQGAQLARALGEGQRWAAVRVHGPPLVLQDGRVSGVVQWHGHGAVDLLVAEVTCNGEPGLAVLDLPQTQLPGGVSRLERALSDTAVDDACYCTGASAVAGLQRLRAWEEVHQGARVVGLVTHLLELWRAGLSAQSPATLASQAPALGEAWASLAALRALLLTVLVGMDAGEDPAVVRGMLRQESNLLHRRVLLRATAAVGAEAARPGTPMRGHLEALALAEARKPFAGAR